MSFAFKVPSMLLSLCIIVFCQISIAAEPTDKDVKEKKEVGEASYNVSNCESVNDSDGTHKKPDTDVEQKNLDKCTSLVK